MLQIPLPVAQLVLSAFNHITRQQPHLRESLVAHQGRVLRIHVVSPLAAADRPEEAPSADWLARMLPSWQSDARIGIDGTLSAVSGETPAATLTVRPSADTLFAALRDGPQALGASLRIEGDVMLASALGQLAKSLHWDLEEDLSRVVGDVAAHRAGMAWRGARQQAAVTRDRVREALTQHLSNDQGVLVSRAEFDAFAADIRLLAQQLTQLESRVGTG